MDARAASKHGRTTASRWPDTLTAPHTSRASRTGAAGSCAHFDDARGPCGRRATRNGDIAGRSLGCVAAREDQPAAWQRTASAGSDGNLAASARGSSCAGGQLQGPAHFRLAVGHAARDDLSREGRKS